MQKISTSCANIVEVQSLDLVYCVVKNRIHCSSEVWTLVLYTFEQSKEHRIDFSEQLRRLG